MGGSNSIALSDAEIEDIMHQTGFNKKQIQRLYSRFSALDKSGCGRLTRQDFIRIPELAINPIGDPIVNLFFSDEREEIDFTHFALILSVFRPTTPNSPSFKNTREDKLKYMFRIYDLDSDGKINRRDLTHLINLMVGDNITDEQKTGIADRTMAEADEDEDGSISYDEFRKAMERIDIDQKLSIKFMG